MSGVMEFALTEKYRRYASRRRIKSVLWLVCGSILMSAGFVLFMNPYQVVPGGVYGLGIVLHALFPSIQVGTFGLMFDIPLLLIGLKVFGRMFGAKTVTAALLIPVLIIVMFYTGMCLWGTTMNLPFFAAGTELVGGAMSMRIIHYFLMYVFICFMFIHIYLANIEGIAPTLLMFFHKEHGGLVYDPDKHVIVGEDDLKH